MSVSHSVFLFKMGLDNDNKNTYSTVPKRTWIAPSKGHTAGITLTNVSCLFAHKLGFSSPSIINSHCVGEPKK